ncbi:hypothetical protein D3C75_1132530 [compost metagenome]
MNNQKNKGRSYAQEKNLDDFYIPDIYASERLLGPDGIKRVVYYICILHGYQ